MGLFDSFLQNETPKWPGFSLESMAQLEELIESSFSIPQLVFKHSTRCSISRYVLSDFISGYSFSAQDFGAWYLDLLNFRSISNAVADRLEVTHQSPQLLVIKNGKVVAYSSHEQINSLVLSGFLN